MPNYSIIALLGIGNILNGADWFEGGVVVCCVTRTSGTIFEK
jgi:hypothetical protein